MEGGGNLKNLGIRSPCSSEGKPVPNLGAKGPCWVVLAIIEVPATSLPRPYRIPTTSLLRTALPVTASFQGSPVSKSHHWPDPWLAARTWKEKVVT